MVGVLISIYTTYKCSVGCARINKFGDDEATKLWIKINFRPEIAFFLLQFFKLVIAIILESFGHYGFPIVYLYLSLSSIYISFTVISVYFDRKKLFCCAENEGEITKVE